MEINRTASRSRSLAIKERVGESKEDGEFIVVRPWRKREVITERKAGNSSANERDNCFDYS